MGLGQLVGQSLLVGEQKRKGVGFHALFQSLKCVFGKTFYCFNSLGLPGQSLAQVVPCAQGGITYLLLHSSDSFAKHAAFFP